MYYNIKPRLYTISTYIVIINIIYFLVLELSGASASVEGMLSFGAARADLIFFDHQYFRLLSAMLCTSISCIYQGICLYFSYLVKDWNM